MAMLARQQNERRLRNQRFRRAREARKEEIWRQMNDLKMRVADSDKDGILDEDELLTMMLLVHEHHEGGKFQGKVKPDNRDAKFLLATCDKDDSGGIERDEFENALNTYAMYLESQEEIEQIFDEFDKNESGRLEQEQLRAFINENVLAEDDEPLQDSELQAVMDYCNEVGSGEPGVGKFEVKFAQEEVYRIRKANDPSCSIQ